MRLDTNNVVGRMLSNWNKVRLTVKRRRGGLIGGRLTTTSCARLMEMFKSDGTTYGFRGEEKGFYLVGYSSRRVVYLTH